MAVNAAPLRAILFKAQQAISISPWFDVRPYSCLTVYFKTTGVPGAGTAIIEEGDFDDLSEAAPNATYSAIATVGIVASVATNGQYAYHIGGPGGAYAYSHVRVRLSVAVTTATLDVVLVGV